MRFWLIDWLKQCVDRHRRQQLDARRIALCGSIGVLLDVPLASSSVQEIFPLLHGEHGDAKSNVRLVMVWPNRRKVIAWQSPRPYDPRTAWLRTWSVKSVRSTSCWQHVVPRTSTFLFRALVIVHVADPYWNNVILICLYLANCLLRPIRFTAYVYVSINQFNSNLAVRQPDSKWYAVEIIDKKKLKLCGEERDNSHRGLKSTRFPVHTALEPGCHLFQFASDCMRHKVRVPRCRRW